MPEDGPGSGLNMDNQDLPTPEHAWPENAPAATAPPSLADLASAVREAAPSARAVRPASFAPRFWANFVDAAALFLMSLMFVGIVAVADAVAGFSEVAVVVVMSGYLALVLAYGASEAYGTATPGKSFVGLRVVGRDGRPTTVGRRVGRWAVKQSPLICFAGTFSLFVLSNWGAPVPEVLGVATAILSRVLTLAVSLGCLLVLLPARLALHDLLTGTAVYREQDVVRDVGHGFRPLPLQAQAPPPAEDSINASA